MQVGPYTIVSELARGGMGVVYRATGAQGERVALKLLREERVSDPGVRARFEKEVQALARLRHPNLVTLLGNGTHEGTPWLALEFVDGPTLEERLRLGPLPIDEAIQITRQLASALAYVHGCGILHRDLKPGNVLLRGDQPLLTDFGLALEEDGASTRVSQTGVFLGTPGYWAPEQAQGDKHGLGAWTDVYGLGGLLYACLTGNPPVEAQDFQDYLRTARFTQSPAPRVVRREVPAWLSTLCMRCLASDPKERPASADEVARSLVLDAGSPPAPTAASERSTAALAGALGLIALLAGGVLLALLWDTAGSPTPTPPDATPAASTDDPPTPDGVTNPPATPTQAPRLQTLLDLAHEHLQAERHQEAIDAAQSALLLAPEHSLAYLLRGTANLGLSRYADAIADFDEALRLDPEQANGYYNRANAYVRLEKYPEAIEDFSTTLRLDPRHLEGRINRGNAYMALRKLDHAVADFSEALRLEPQSFDALYNRGNAHTAAQRFSAAIEDYTQALALRPTDVKLLTNRGLAFSRLGAHEQALTDLEYALRIEPGLPRVLRACAMAHFRLGNHEQACAAYDEVLRKVPRDASARINRGHARLLRGDLQGALEDLDEGIRLEARSHVAFLHRATAKWKLGQLEAAIADFDQSLRLEPRNALALRRRGHVKLTLGRQQEAIADFDQALALSKEPAFLDAVRRLRAQALERLKR